MKGQVLSFVLTIIFVVMIVVILTISLLMSLVLKNSQAQRIVDMTSATGQPLAIAGGLVGTKLIDGRTLLDEALHATGGAPLLMPSLASSAMASWEIGAWQIVVSRQAEETGIGIGAARMCFAESASGVCSFGRCPSGSYTITGQCRLGQSCCSEDYDMESKSYRTIALLQGMTTCGPVNEYYGVCEPGGCSLGRKDIGLSTCPDMPVGNHCCRPYLTEEKTLIPAMNNASIPLLYPGMSGTLVISVSAPKGITG
jgi:hypothetical protein